MQMPPMPPGGAWPPPMMPGYGAPPVGFPGMPPVGMPGAPMAAPVMPVAPISPNPTVYIQNLNEKIKLEELKEALTKVFSQFGNIMEIKAEKRLKLRGQAWIVYDNVEAATKALGEMQGFQFYDKPMRVAFAKVKSDIISKADGSFVHRPKRKVEKKSRKKKGKKGKVKKETKTEDDGGMKDEEEAPKKEEEAAAPAPVAAPVVVEVPPNRILFVENLPSQCTEHILSRLFSRHPGFKEARLVPGRAGIAFVEFEEVFQAGTAKDALHEFKFTPTNLMKVSFARQ